LYDENCVNQQILMLEYSVRINRIFDIDELIFSRNDSQTVSYY
jgi:hypothetical protein